MNRQRLVLLSVLTFVFALMIMSPLPMGMPEQNTVGAVRDLVPVDSPAALSNESWSLVYEPHGTTVDYQNGSYTYSASVGETNTWNGSVYVPYIWNDATRVVSYAGVTMEFYDWYIMLKNSTHTLVDDGRWQVEYWTETGGGKWNSLDLYSHDWLPVVQHETDMTFGQSYTDGSSEMNVTYAFRNCDEVKIAIDFVPQDAGIYRFVWQTTGIMDGPVFVKDKNNYTTGALFDSLNIVWNDVVDLNGLNATYEWSVGDKKLDVFFGNIILGAEESYYLDPTYTVAADIDDDCWEGTSYHRTGYTVNPVHNYYDEDYRSQFRLSLAIPKDSTIDTATLTIYVIDTSAQSITIATIYEANVGSLEGDSARPTPTAADTITQAIFTSAGFQTSNSIVDMIQARINGLNWESGWYVGIQMRSTGTDSTCSLEDYQHANSHHAYMTITFTLPNTAPAVTTNPTCTNEETGGWLLSRMRTYTFHTKVEDAEGYSNINYVDLRFRETGVATIWSVRHTYSSNGWSEQSGGTFIELVSGSCSRTLSGSSSGAIGYIELTFALRLEWAHADITAPTELYTYVIDSALASGSGTGSEVFDVESDLDFSSFSLSDGSGTVDRGNYNTVGGITASGVATYQGLSFHPASSFIDVWVTCADTPDTDWEATNYEPVGGTFSVAVDSDNIVTGSPNVYYFKPVDQGTGSGGTNRAHATHSDEYKADRVQVQSYSSGDARINIDTAADNHVFLLYDYDDGSVVDGTVTVNGVSASYSGAQSAWDFGDTKTSAQDVTYNNVQVTGNAHGITVEDQNGQSLLQVWDSVTITITGPTDNRQNLNANASGIHVSGVYDYSGTFDGSFIMNNTDYNGDGTVAKWGYTVSSISGGTHGITVISVNDDTYMIWDQIEVYYCDASDPRTNIDEQEYPYFRLRLKYDGHLLNHATDDDVWVNSSVAAWSSGTSSWYKHYTQTTVGTWNFVVTSASEYTYGITAFNSASAVTYGEDIIWDEIEVFYGTVSDSRTNINEQEYPYFRLRLKYDNHLLDDGSNDAVYINSSVATWSGSGATGGWHKNYDFVTVGLWNFLVTSASESTHGITAFDSASAVTYDQDIIWDEIEVYYCGVSDPRTNINEQEYPYFRLRLKYDGHLLNHATDDDVWVNSSVAAWSSGVSSWYKHYTQVTVGTWNFVVTSASENTHGITAFDSASAVTYDQDIIWDRVEIYSLTASDAHLGIGSPMTLSYYLKYAYDGLAVGSGGTYTTDETSPADALVYQSGNLWQATANEAGVGAVTFNGFTTCSDSSYGLTAWTFTGSQATVTWDRVRALAIEVSDDRCNYGSTQWVRVRFDYESAGHGYVTTWGTGPTITGPNGAITLSVDDSNGWWRGSTGVYSSVSKFTYNTNTLNNYVDVDSVLARTKGSFTAVTTWDRILINTVGTTIGHLDYGTETVVYATAYLECTTDGTHWLGSGDTLYINDGGSDFLMVWNATSSRFEYDSTKSSVNKWTWTVSTSNANETSYAITSLNQNAKSVDVIWDRIIIITTVATDDYIDRGVVDTTTINVTARLEYTVGGEHWLGASDSLYCNDTLMSWSSDHFYVVVGPYDVFDSWSFFVNSTGASEATYSITVVNVNGQSDTVSADRIKVLSYSPSDARDNVDDYIWVVVVLEYELDSSNVVDGTVTINGYSFSYVATNQWRHNRTESTVASVTYNSVVASGNARGITVVNNNGQSQEVVWDRVRVVSYTIVTPSGDNRNNIGTTYTIDVELHYDYDETDLVDGTVTVNGHSAVYQSAGKWRLTDSESTVMATTYNNVQASGNAYGITAELNTVTQQVIWDRIKILTTSATSSYIDKGTESTTVNVTAELQYDSHGLGSGDTLYMNNTLMIWDTDHYYIVFGPYDVFASWVLFVNSTSANEATYGITVVWLNGQSDTVATDRVKVISYAVNDARVNIDDYIWVNVTVQYESDSSLVVDGTIVVNGYSFSHLGSGVWRHNRTQASVVGINFNSVVAAGNARGITVVNQNGQSQLSVWDQIEAYWNYASDSRTNVGEQEYPGVRLRLKYDNHLLDDYPSDSAQINGSAASWAGGLYWFKYYTQSTVGTWNFVVTSASENTYGITAFDSASAVTYDVDIIWDQIEMTYLIGDNTGYNWDFELGNLSGWTAQEGSPTVTVDSVHGDVLHFPGDGLYQRVISNGLIPVSPGDVFYGELWYNASAGSLGYFGGYFGAAGWQYFASSWTKDGTWYYRYGSITVPAGATHMHVWLFNYVGNTGELEFDDVRIWSDEVDLRTDIDDTVVFHAQAQLDYDSHALGSGDSFTISGIAFSWNATLGCFTGTDSSGSVTSTTYDAFGSGSEATYGITVGVMNSWNMTQIWDELEVYWHGYSDQRADVGETEWVLFSVRSQYDTGHYVNASSTDVVRINGTIATYYVAGDAWYINIIGTDVGLLHYVASSAVDVVYGVTALNSASAETHMQYQIWDRVVVWFFEADDYRASVDTNVEVRVRAWLEYDKHNFTSGDSVSVNGTALSWDAGNEWFEYSFSQSTVGRWCYNVTSVNEATHTVTVFEFYTGLLSDDASTFARTSDVDDFKVGDYSCEIWFKWVGDTWTYSAILVGDRLSDNGFMLYRNSPWTVGQLGWLLYYTNTTADSMHSILYHYDLQKDVWYHSVVVVNSSGNRWLYLDGDLVYAWEPPSDFDYWDITGVSYFYVGSDGGGTAGVQQIGDVRFYNRTLSAAEIYEHYYGVFDDESGLVAHYELSGDLTDSAGSHDLSVVGSGSLEGEGNPLYIVWDRVYMNTWYTPDQRDNIGDNVINACRFWLEYDDYSLQYSGAGQFTCEGAYMIWAGGSEKWYRTLNYAYVHNETVTISTVNELAFGVTVFTNTTWATWIVWDEIEVYYSNVIDARDNVGDQNYPMFRLRLKYDSHLLDDGTNDIININSSIATWYGAGEYWYKFYTKETVDSWNFLVTSASENTYGITAFDTSSAVTYDIDIIWDRIILTSSVNASWTVIGYYTNVSYTGIYEYDSASWSGYATIANTSLTTGGAVHYEELMHSLVANKTFYATAVEDAGGYDIMEFTTTTVYCVWDDAEVSSVAYYWTQYSVDQVWLIWQSGTWTWKINGTTVDTGVDSGQVCVLQSKMNGTDDDWAIVDATGQIGDLLIGVFNTAWYHVNVSVHVETVIDTRVFDWQVWTAVLDVDILHSIHIEDSGMDIQDAWVTFFFHSNWNNATFTIWDNSTGVGVEVGHSGSEGWYQIAKPTVVAVHWYWILINGTNSGSTSAGQTFDVSDTSDSWVWLDFKLTVNPTILSLSNPVVSGDASTGSLTVEASAAGDYYVYDNDTYQSVTGSFAAGIVSLTWSKLSTVGLHEWGVKFNDSTTVLWINGSYYVSAAVLYIQDAVYSATDDWNYLGGYATVAVTTWVAYNNDTEMNTGALGAGSFAINWEKNTTVGLYEWGVSFTDGIDIRWVNGSYAVSEATTDFDVTESVGYSDNWITLNVISNWGNATYYVWNNDSLIGGSLEGWYQVAKPTSIGLHNITILVNGSQSVVTTGEQTKDFSEDDAWIWLNLQYTVNPVTFSIGNIDMDQDNNTVSVSGQIYTTILDMTYIVYENNSQVSSGSFSVDESGGWFSIGWTKVAWDERANFKLTMSDGTNNVNVTGFYVLFEGATTSIITNVGASWTNEYNNFTSYDKTPEAVQMEQAWVVLGDIIKILLTAFVVSIAYYVGVKWRNKKSPRDRSNDAYRNRNGG